MTTGPAISRSWTWRISLAVRAAVAASAALLAGGAQAAAVLPGGNSKQPVIIKAAKLDYFDKEQKLIYSGGVIANQGDSKLKCSVLVIYLPPKNEGASATPSSSSQVQRMEATGPVTMISKDQVGTGDNGVYDRAADTVVLTGNVTLSQGPNVTLGDVLTYRLSTARANVTAVPPHEVRSSFVINHADDAPPSTKKTNPPRSRRTESVTQ